MQYIQHNNYYYRLLMYSAACSRMIVVRANLKEKLCHSNNLQALYGNSSYFMQKLVASVGQLYTLPEVKRVCFFSTLLPV